MLARVGAVAYKLDLPATSLIHHVVPVSQLKKHVPPNTEVLDSLDSVATYPEEQLLPVQVFSEAFARKNNKMVPRVKVLSEKLPDSMASWEDPQDMQRRYPTAWGQAVLKGEGNVSNLMLKKSR